MSKLINDSLLEKILKYTNKQALFQKEKSKL